MIQPSADDTHARAGGVHHRSGRQDSALHPYYPLSNGRNILEILRLVVALQTTDRFQVATPADWQPGEDVIVPPPGSPGGAAETPCAEP